MRARNPDRIDPIIEQLRAAWKANPDLRLTQLVWFLSGQDYASAPFFHTEDTSLQWSEVPVTDPSWGGPYWIEVR